MDKLNKLRWQREYESKRREFMGMNPATARARLSASILFDFAGKLGLLDCWQCDEPIKTPAEFSIEHKKPYLWKDLSLYWDLDNIAFSHLVCNRKRTRNGAASHSRARYMRKQCQCQICHEIKLQYNRDWYHKNKN